MPLSAPYVQGVLGRSVRRRPRGGTDHELARRRLAMLGVELARTAPTDAVTAPTDAVTAPPDAMAAPPDEPADEPPEPPSVPADSLPTAVNSPGRHAARPAAARVRWRAALSDRLSPSMRSAMDGTFSGHHLGVLAVVLAAGLAMTAWWVLSGRPEQQAVPPASFGPSTIAPDADEPTASPTSSAGASPSAGELIVDVAGKVRRPGIVTLPAGSRVIDALEAAGGARPGVDLADLNLARVLVDGEQILVGMTPVVAPSSAATATASSSTGSLVNINTADQATLETLPGVGPVTAQAILDWRAENGAFTTVDELLEVDGIGDVTLAELRDLVTV
jgi:competence protein ComEA